MTVNTQTKDNADVILKPWKYVKVAEAQVPNNSEGHASVYLNIEGIVNSGCAVGGLRVKANRRRNNDATSYHSYTVLRKSSGAFNHLITLTWFGNVVPGEWFDYYVKLEDNIVSAVANSTDADHAKAMNN